MKYTEVFLTDLERELPATRRVLERIPDGKFDWKPHEKSMPLGYLAVMVASMPEWLGLVIELDELDIAPRDGKSKFQPAPMKTAAEFVKGLDAAAEKGRQALRKTNDAHLENPWRLLAGGNELQSGPKHQQIRDGVLSHWIHHRAQLAVYLKMLGAKVPSMYGPSGDEPPPKA